MTAGSSTTLLPALHVDPVDYLLVDIATGRHLPGDGVHPEQLAHEHGLSHDDAVAALDAAWCLGLISRDGITDSGVVAWSPEQSQVHLHRLARAMVAAVCGSALGRAPLGVIDGERDRYDVVDLFGLTVPCDLALFLELGRALLGSAAPALVDELTTPIAVLFSTAGQAVHGVEIAAPTNDRREIVCAMVASLIDGRTDDFGDLVADYVVAMSIA